MYSIDLNKFNLKEFSEILHSIDLLPSRKILLDHLEETLAKLSSMNICNLADLQRLLKNKNEYPSLTKKLSVSEKYLTILNREVNTYKSKAISLAKIKLFTEEEIESLREIGIKTTKNLYEKCLKSTDRDNLVIQTNIDEKKLRIALEMVDLIRVNGIGPVYAKILNEIGIKNITDYLNMDSKEILSKYRKTNKKKAYSKAKLGIKDIEYCKRFCKKLDEEIEW